MRNKHYQSNHNCLQALDGNKCIVNHAVINVPISEKLLMKTRKKSSLKCVFVFLLTKDNIFIQAVSTIVHFKHWGVRGWRGG